MKNIILILCLPLQLFAQQFNREEINRWESEAKQVTIIRDNWGIPHIYGKTDADCVFGLLYAQCEDDFERVEMNYIEKLGRMAEVKGESELYNDLLIKLIIDSADAVSDYKNSAPWLKKLLNAYADGVNYFLYKNPSVIPVLLHSFQPWYPLLWTDGSIGAINTAGITAEELKNFYSGKNGSTVYHRPYYEKMQTGSNGFAISPSKTESGNAILYINPHVTFYFRPEAEMESEEGLHAYGAVTWGQFFIYQGFNEHCGWMHTSGYSDNADLYAEKIITKSKTLYYEYNQSLRPVIQKQILLHYKKGNTLQSKTITTYFTHHGPIMAKRNDQWLSMKANNRDMNGLIQCWERTKSNSFEEFKKIMDLRANTSNNTVYADSEGNIAYWHGNFIPVRDKIFDWSKPVDGSISSTEWKGLHTIDEMLHIYNPPNGWIQNCNSSAFTAAGNSSPKKENYPSYMAPDGENFRGINAVRVLSKENSYTPDKVIAAGYDTYLSAFEKLIPALINAFDKTVKRTDPLYAQLIEPVLTLKKWNLYSSETSVATTLAVEWGEKLLPAIYRNVSDDEAPDEPMLVQQFADTVSAAQLIQPLATVINELKNKFGNWQIAWGTINRYQRSTAFPNEKFDDSQPSLPVGRASSTWGSLPSFASRYYPGTQKRYGYNGNSFICAVEFGKRVKAKSLLTGGESGNPDSPHFSDQALMYAQGQFKNVLFYKEDVLLHAEKIHHPGE